MLEVQQVLNACADLLKKCCALRSGYHSFSARAEMEGSSLGATFI